MIWMGQSVVCKRFFAYKHFLFPTRGERHRCRRFPHAVSLSAPSKWTAIINTLITIFPICIGNKIVSSTIDNRHTDMTFEICDLAKTCFYYLHDYIGCRLPMGSGSLRCPPLASCAAHTVAINIYFGAFTRYRTHFIYIVWPTVHCDCSRHGVHWVPNADVACAQLYAVQPKRLSSN